MHNGPEMEDPNLEKIQMDLLTDRGNRGEENCNDPIGE